MKKIVYIKNWFNGGHFGFYPKTRRFLCVVLISSTEANYVEKHLLTFLSIK